MHTAHFHGSRGMTAEYISYRCLFFSLPGPNGQMVHILVTKASEV